MHSEAEREGERREHMRFSRDETREMQFWWNACMHCVCAEPLRMDDRLEESDVGSVWRRAIEALAFTGHSTKPKQAARAYERNVS